MFNSKRKELNQLFETIDIYDVFQCLSKYNGVNDVSDMVAEMRQSQRERLAREIEDFKKDHDLAAIPRWVDVENIIFSYVVKESLV
ncbi:MAG: hypothetical protein LBN08_04670 [Lactobacillales bacterium]|jgi:phage regulator Rha-like protein|nr:hypothetical protein [Lactobacillales bacterium]